MLVNFPCWEDSGHRSSSYVSWNVRTCTYVILPYVKRTLYKIIKTTVDHCRIKISYWLSWLLNACGVILVNCRYFINTSIYGYRGLSKSARLCVPSDETYAYDIFEMYLLVVRLFYITCMLRSELRWPWYLTQMTKTMHHCAVKPAAVPACCDVNPEGYCHVKLDIIQWQPNYVCTTSLQPPFSQLYNIENILSQTCNCQVHWKLAYKDRISANR